MKNAFIGCQPAGLEDILAEKERRMELQRELLAAYGKTVVCVTLNLPGPYKSYPLAAKCFYHSVRDVEEALPVKPIHRKETECKAGFAAYFVVDYPANGLKKIMTALEENHPAGRMLDLDVLDLNGKISREAIGLSQRQCLICPSPAFQCARSRAHALDDVVQRSLDIMRGYMLEVYCDTAVSAAMKALLDEVAATPKPGLVDRHNNGSHQDMDFFTFIDSAASLLPYFRDCVKAGFWHNDSPEELFLMLRAKGMVAEKKMLEATNGVNTHKGVIFSLGALCAAYGVLCGREQAITDIGLFDYCTEMTKSVLDDFAGVTAENAKTNGERLYAQYGISGIRGEVASGFPSIRQYGLPTLRKMLRDGCSMNDAGVAALLALMAYVDDTNIIHRADMQTLRRMQSSIREFLATGPSVQDILHTAHRLDRECILKNISAGGCADLLAITYFIHFLV